MQKSLKASLEINHVHFAVNGTSIDMVLVTTFLSQISTHQQVNMTFQFMDIDQPDTSFRLSSGILPQHRKPYVRHQRERILSWLFVATLHLPRTNKPPSGWR